MPNTADTTRVAMEEDGDDSLELDGEEPLEAASPPFRCLETEREHVCSTCFWHILLDGFEVDLHSGDPTVMSSIRTCVW